jgi:hypothetical protein
LPRIAAAAVALDLARVGRRVGGERLEHGGGFGGSDETALAPAAGVDLRLHDDAAAEFLGDLAGLGGRGCDAAAGQGHALAGKQITGLVLVQFQSGAPKGWWAKPTRGRS